MFGPERNRFAVYHAGLRGIPWKVGVKKVMTMEEKAPVTDGESLHMQLVRLSGRERRAYWMAKRTFDICFSTAALILLSPVFLVFSVMIWLDDPHGCPIYSQTRIGRRGKPFRLYKFRSMVVDADQMLENLRSSNEKDGPVFKIKNDPRITRMGKFLRRTSLDELPQFWNVLKGDMSIVGPRPPLPREVEQYSPYQMDRLLVTPGITCYWQTRKNRDNLSFQDWVDLDIRYIQERSMLVDLKLILLTIKVVLTGEGT